MLNQRAAGFTIIELLISAGILGIVLFFILGTFTVQHQTYVVIDHLSEAQQTATALV